MKHLLYYRPSLRNKPFFSLFKKTSRPCLPNYDRTFYLKTNLRTPLYEQLFLFTNSFFSIYEQLFLSISLDFWIFGEHLSDKEQWLTLKSNNSCFEMKNFTIFLLKSCVVTAEYSNELAI